MFKTIIAIIFLITAIAIFFIWSQPVFQEIKDLQAQKASFDEILSTAKQIQETRDALLSQYNAISQENLDRLNKILPSQPGSIKYIIEINNILGKNGMVLKSIDIKENAESGQVSFGEEKQPFEVLPVSIKATGSYKSFYSFLKDLDNNLRLTDINALSFSSGGTSDQYDFNISASIYWQK
jgi:Tfp pilus assembly protein PilO